MNPDATVALTCRRDAHCSGSWRFPGANQPLDDNIPRQSLQPLAVVFHDGDGDVARLARFTVCHGAGFARACVDDDPAILIVFQLRAWFLSHRLPSFDQ